jgi:sugar/nucleoside kinase (ribokinase family)
MITDRGAGEALSPEDLPEIFFRGGHLHLSDYTFSEGSRRETDRKAVRLAREAEMSISVDPSSVPLLEAIGPERFLEWTRGADLCFLNLEDGALLGGAEDPDRIARGCLATTPASSSSSAWVAHCTRVRTENGCGCRRFRRGWWTRREPVMPCARAS